MGCVIIRQAIRQAKRRYNLRLALCYVININNKINGRFAVYAERGRPYERIAGKDSGME